MSWKPFVTAYLSYSRKERIALLTLGFIILIIYLISYVFAFSSAPVTVYIDSNLVAELDTKQATEEHRNENETSYEERQFSAPARLFVFDPNTATVDELVTLGLSLKTAQTIDKYRKKGGRFRTREDLQKIWGLPPGFYERIKDHISIISEPAPEAIKSFPPAPRREPAVLDGNSADSTAFESLPGIGPKLAARIVQFRDKLGGFYAVEQLAETYGLPDSTFQKIKHRVTVDSSQLRKININTADIPELRAHPYIRWNLANAIVAYRKQHGEFQRVEELLKIGVVDEQNFQKVRAYLIVK